MSEPEDVDKEPVYCYQCRKVQSTRPGRIERYNSELLPSPEKCVTLRRYYCAVCAKEVASVGRSGKRRNQQNEQR
jgi:hypothetical protein